MTYKVTAPLVIIPNADGISGDWYGYDGALVPQGLNDERCEQLAKEGMLSGSSAADGAPAKSAAKGDWQEYARTQGATDADLEGMTKEDLVGLYGGDGS